MEEYFGKFPVVSYANTLCRDISRRVRLSSETRKNLALYYSYEIKDGMRADIIADKYYEEPTLDWLLWLANDIVDPYYQWNLSEQDFNDYLIKKYGSRENAIERIAFYRNNWYENDEEQMDPEFYNNTLPYLHRKYYEPVFGKGSDVLFWRRRREDWVQATNKIYKLTCNSTPFVVGEIVDVTNASTIRVGGGEVDNISNTAIWIKHIDGSFANNNIVTGETSLEDKIITDVELVYEAITEDEGVFWSSVSYLDIEEERNAYARGIRILDSANRLSTTEQIRKALRE